MRIDFNWTSLKSSIGDGPWQWLLGLVGEKGRVEAEISRVFPDRLILQVGGREMALALPAEQGFLFVPGTVLEISQKDSQLVLMTKSTPPAQPADDLQVSADLEGALRDLNMEASPSSTACARALLENGFPLRAELIRALQPLEEKGLLKEALLLVKAGFPLTEELAKIVEKVGTNPISETSVLEKDRELLKWPQWATRAQLGTKIKGGPLLKNLAQLFVQEQVLTSLSKQANIFALPFLVDSHLFTAWVQIQSKGEPGSASDKGKQGSFVIRFLIPTKTWGMVGGRLAVQAKKMRLLLQVEKTGGIDALQKELNPLPEELRQAGWDPIQLEVVLGSALSPREWIE